MCWASFEKLPTKSFWRRLIFAEWILISVALGCFTVFGSLGIEILASKRVFPYVRVMEVTAYSAGPESTGKDSDHPDYGLTASTHRIRVGAGERCIAAPPDITFGTRIFVPGYGAAAVKDRGEAIQGSCLDVYYDDVDTAWLWGRKTNGSSNLSVGMGGASTQRWIMHVDMDAFFAAVEQRDNSALKGKPVIVGGCGARGVVATASYEARKFGVRSAMSTSEARRRCPHAVFLPCDHKRYTEVSCQIKNLMAEFSPVIEPLSLDEAFLDVSGMEQLYRDPVEIAIRIKERIRQEVGLTASAGVAPNKFVAKVASDIRKPDGLLIVRPGEVKGFLAPLPVSRLWGVGEVTEKILIRQGIKTIGQLAAIELRQLETWLGNAAAELKLLAAGIDDRSVIPDHALKSVGNEETFAIDIFDPDEVRTNLLGLAVHVAWRLRLLGLTGRTITLKIRSASFKTVTRSRTMSEPTCLEDVLFTTALELAQKVTVPEGIRLLGLTVSGLTTGITQGSLFAENDEKQLAVAKAVDKLREKFGVDIVSRGRLLQQHKHHG